ncbi:MAG: 2-hydroxy-3-oxopropionate reductase [Candidatus Accumulibacter appositus]|uniref:2-hydroxy-3-oxopropionate reductase n=1 Tax=Candidatus Accumulibacter appositus TaxID=1454003 RepID=A0A011NBM6_9PROT|nr:NAD(P)-dependent oxidoreductase [Accumulibacter sp.]EXI80048.1 MAG: 2-hydroxy-3-oxopropionate reductase [Candidatus Accumulibacter appositus]HRF06172.1 NAD(P)-dependent oxidoreductase [Accumulibacter sp.]
MQIGFIGLGVMGQAMALNLLRGGHRLALWARRPEVLQPLLEAGAVACATPAAVGRRSEVVFTMLTAGADVERVALGLDGLVEGLSAASLLVDMSTIAPEMARSLALRLGEQGIDMLDAPVSGGGQAAAAASLAIMVGGKAAVLERARPLLELLGKTIVHVGDNGAGQVAKACNQMIMVGAIQAAAEALHFAAAAGADPAKVRQALAGGSAGSRALEIMGGRMVDRDFAAGVEARLHHKDYGILMQEAHRLGVPLPVAAQVWQQLNALMAMGWGRSDTASLLRVLEASQRAAG